MKKAYRVLARLIAALVVVQVAAIAYGAFAIDKVIDKAKDHGNTVADASSKLDGGAGYGIHGLVGIMLIPLVAIILFVVAFMAHVPDGVKWAGFVLLDVIVQVALGLAAHSVPALGWLHGPNALVLFGLAIYAARRSASPSAVTTAAQFASVRDRRRRAATTRARRCRPASYGYPAPAPESGLVALASHTIHCDNPAPSAPSFVRAS